MKKFLLILLVAIAPLGLLAQTPGYMGKRILLTGRFGSIVNFFPGLPNHNFSHDVFKFSLRYDFDLDYVTHRKGSFGLSVGRAITAIEYSEEITIGPPGSTLTTSIYDYASIRGTAIGINYKSFHHKSKGALAPVGNFSRFGFSMLFYKVIPYTEGVTGGLDENAAASFATPLFSYTYGKQRVFFDHLVFKSSVTLELVPAGILAALRDSGFSSENTSSSNNTDRLEEMKSESLKRLTMYYLLHFNVGVGFLIPYRQAQ